jgi:ATP-dependent Zn protease
VNAIKFYLFERPKAEVYIANYIDKAGLLILIITFISDIVSQQPSIKINDWILVFILIIIFMGLFEIFFRRVAFCFFFFRHRKGVTAKIEDIKEIRMSAYITFMINDKKVYYNDVVNKELVAFLQKLKPTKWSRLGLFLHKYW